jgi:UDP-glucuronate 4-epimerase
MITTIRALKEARLAQLAAAGLQFCARRCFGPRGDAGAGLGPDITHVVHLAAQAGVRYSMIDPYAYVTANVMGQVVMLELARLLPRLEHFVYAVRLPRSMG